MAAAGTGSGVGGPSGGLVHLLIGHPATATKKSWYGMSERRAALAVAGINLHHVDANVGSSAGVDDILDAAVAAWSALRLLAGSAVSIPDPPEKDMSGRDMAIWA